MRSRTLATVAMMFALGSALLVVGCSEEALPPPTVDNSNVEAQKSTEPTLGIETSITVTQLAEKLEATGLKVAEAPTKESGLFIPAKYLPMKVDGAFVQAYRFKGADQAKGAAATVDADGYVLGATPGQLINVNWTGWPAFFRSGELVVIFVTEKGSKNATRDRRVYEALKSVMGDPFMGSNNPPPAAHATESPEATGSSPATGTGD